MLVVLVTATIVTVLNNSMITVVLAAVGRDLSATPSALGWTATGYLLPFAAGNALAGLLSDRVSLRRVFTLGLIVFAVGTVAAATAPSVNWLIIARGVQGAGGSVVPALSAVAIARVFEAGRRGPVFGLLAAGTGAAQAAGPVVGGALGEVAGWRSLFWVSTALVVPVLIGAARTLATADHPAATPGAELTPPGAVRRASFAGACGVGLLALLTYLAVEILVPLQVAELNGTGVFATGLVLLPGALITVALSRAAGHWSDRRGDRRVAVVGAAVMAVAAGGLSTVAGSGPVLVGAGMLVLGLGFALVVVSAVNAAARALPPARMGVGLGIYQSAFYVGGALGALLSTASLTARSGATSSAWNPLHHGAGSAFSDALLISAAVAVAAAVLAAATFAATAAPGQLSSP
jgi:DHA2 family metal-tetracycline-proton antiporter-like MFS transporter